MSFNLGFAKHIQGLHASHQTFAISNHDSTKVLSTYLIFANQHRTIGCLSNFKFLERIIKTITMLTSFSH